MEQVAAQISVENDGGDNLLTGEIRDGRRGVHDDGVHQPDLELVKRELCSGWSAVLAVNGRVLDKEKGRGIKPAFLIVRRRLKSMGSFKPLEPHLVFGDKVLGLAAFRLGALAGARVMWGDMVSGPAAEEATRRGVKMGGSEFVPFILNRDGVDLCPMEKLASSCTDDAQFYAELKKLFIGR